MCDASASPAKRSLCLLVQSRTAVGGGHSCICICSGCWRVCCNKTL